MIRMLLTGGTGFFGRALLRYLSSGQGGQRAQAYNEVIVLTRSPTKFLGSYPEFGGISWLKFCQGDITDLRSLEELSSLGKLHRVIHAATDSTNTAKLNPLQQLDQIVDGTRNILQIAVKHGCERFLLTSSGAVYGPQPPDMGQIIETNLGSPDPLLPSSTYGIGKRMAEHLCNIFNRTAQVEVVIARCFAFVGKDLPLDKHFAIGNFVREALWADEIVVKGDGSPLRTYLDQDDLSNWLLTLLEKGRPGEAYNVGSDEVVSIADLAHLVRDLIAPNKPVRILGKADPSHARNRYVPDIAKARRELGLNVTIPLTASIPRSVEGRLT